MKIEESLRQALRSLINHQSRKDPDRSSARESAYRRALASFTKTHPSIPHILKQEQKARSELERVSKQTMRVLEGYGLRSYGGRKLHIEDATKFTKCGGKIDLPSRPHLPSFGGAMAMLAAATSQQGAALLKQWGVNWS